MSMYPWQEDAWTRLQAMRARLPHAILFHGPAGIGKADFIEAFAQALLCEDVKPDGHACGACASCGWFADWVTGWTKRPPALLSRFALNRHCGTVSPLIPPQCCISCFS